MKHIAKRIISGMLIASLLFLQTPVVFAETEIEGDSAVADGVAYLESQQQPDGSIAGYGGETDWTIIAVAASGQGPDQVVSEAGVSLVDAIENEPMDETAPATDVERRILAIAATGEDTKDFGGVNYNELLADRHIDNQIGDPTLLNDDAFGLMAVAVTQDDALLPMAEDAVDFLLENQDISGGYSWATTDHAWYSGPDSNSTSATIVALQSVDELGIARPELPEALDDAAVFLLSLQDQSGGFLYDIYAIAPDVGSTSWAIMALNTFNDSYLKQIDAARAWLLRAQNEDGGFGYMPGFDSDTFNTPSSILALAGTTWTLQPEPTMQPGLAGIAQETENTVAQAPIILAAHTQTNMTQAPIYAAETGPTVQADVAVEPQMSSIATTVPSTQEIIENVSTSNTVRNIGLVLIAVAVLGFSVYALRLHSVKAE